MKYFIIGLIVVLLFIIIELRREIHAYSKWIISKILFFKKINADLTKNKKRVIDNKTIIQYLDYIDTKLKSITYHRKSQFIINENLYRQLRYSRCDYKYLSKLLSEILEYLNLDKNNLTFEVVPHISSKYITNAAGLYFEDTKHIKLYINNADLVETVIATLIHEVTHYFLLSQNIRIEDRKQNEILTDITTIYLGFGKLMFEGYKHYGKIIYINENTRGIDKRKVGYLYYGDIKYAMKILKRLDWFLNLEFGFWKLVVTFIFIF